MIQFTALIYACVKARFGIENLIFEEIVISTGAKLEWLPKTGQPES